PFRRGWARAVSAVRQRGAADPPPAGCADPLRRRIERAAHRRGLGRSRGYALSDARKLSGDALRSRVSEDPSPPPSGVARGHPRAHQRLAREVVLSGHAARSRSAPMTSANATGAEFLAAKEATGENISL